jgi:hypothetical protein
VASVMADSSLGLRIELLGPVEARVDGRPVALGGQLPRALFAVLALMGGRVVTTERLIDELWGEEPPSRARDSLQMHVSRLRKALSEAGDDGGRLVNQADGYLLDVRPGERDVDRWQRALGQAHRARAGGEPQAARQRIHEALRIWRGQSLGGRTACSPPSALGSRRSASPRSSRGSSSISSWAVTASSWASWTRWSSRTPSRSAWWSCRCWRSIAADDRPTR